MLTDPWSSKGILNQSIFFCLCYLSHSNHAIEARYFKLQNEPLNSHDILYFHMVQIRKQFLKSLECKIIDHWQEKNQK